MKSGGDAFVSEDSQMEFDDFDLTDELKADEIFDN